MLHIGVIGVGGLGSRHLQSLAELKENAVIQVIDTSVESVRKSKELFESMKPKESILLNFVSEIAALNDELDVVIIATSSMPRRKIVEGLLKTKNVKYLILEKVLFPKIEDYYAIDALIKEKQCKVWVNHPRRMLPFFRELAKIFENEKFINVDISGGNWGIGCNTVHFLDLIGQLSGGSEGLILNTERLDNTIIPSKRNGYKEFTGTLMGSMGRCEHFSITSVAGELYPTRIIISGNNTSCIISEAQDKAIVAKAADGWKFEEKTIGGKYQSQLTAGLVEQIVSTGECFLPTYDTAMREHIPFIDAMLKFISKVSGEEVTVCPIT